ncbi:MAG TPA: TrmH family RNA methyltransferase [Myxococcota bacterium]
MNVVVVLVRSKGPLNVGSAARLCGNFGVGLRLVDVIADTESKDAIKMSHPSEQVLIDAPRFSSLKDAVADCELVVGTSQKIASAVAGPVLDADVAAGLFTEGTLALVFGNERTGLSVDEAAVCQRVLRLPVDGSMNLSHAVACALTVLALAKNSTTTTTRASPSSRAALLSAWSQALAAHGFHKDSDPAQFQPRLVEMIDKMDISARDATIMAGMFTLFARQAPTPSV